jgi:hypothetical protein
MPVRSATFGQGLQYRGSQPPGRTFDLGEEIQIGKKQCGLDRFERLTSLSRCS